MRAPHGPLGSYILRPPEAPGEKRMTIINIAASLLELCMRVRIDEHLPQGQPWLGSTGLGWTLSFRAWIDLEPLAALSFRIPIRFDLGFSPEI